MRTSADELEYMVVMERSRDEQQHMNINDLEAVKNPKRTRDELVVNTLAVKFHFYGIAGTETEIFSQDWNKIRILDFSSFNVFRNAAKSVTLYLPWRSLSCYFKTSFYDGGYLFLLNNDCLVRILLEHSYMTFARNHPVSTVLFPE